MFRVLILRSRPRVRSKLWVGNLSHNFGSEFWCVTALCQHFGSGNSVIVNIITTSVFRQQLMTHSPFRILAVRNLFFIEAKIAPCLWILLTLARCSFALEAGLSRRLSVEGRAGKFQGDGKGRFQPCIGLAFAPSCQRWASILVFSTSSAILPEFQFRFSQLPLLWSAFACLASSKVFSDTFDNAMPAAFFPRRITFEISLQRPWQQGAVEPCSARFRSRPVSVLEMPRCHCLKWAVSFRISWRAFGQFRTSWILTRLD